MSGTVMMVMSFLPGIPMLPFICLGGGACAIAFVIERRAKAVVSTETRQGATPAAKVPPAGEPISASLKVDDLKIELGYALLPLVNSPDGSDRLTEQIKALRRSLAMEMGFVMPSVRILDNVHLDANAYVIRIKEVEAGSGRVWPGQFMVMDPGGGQVNIAGIHTTEPTFGLPATWVDGALREEAAVRGYTVVDAATVLATHLTELLKGNVAELLSYGEVQKLIKELPKEQGDLVKDLVPTQITVTGIQRILQLLLAERVRARLARQICAQHTSPQGYVPLISLTAKWEQAFAESILGEGDNRQLAMQPSRLTEFITLVRERFEEAARQGENPVLVTSPGIRAFVRSIVERFRTQTTVLSQSEIHPRARLKTAGSI